MAELCPFCGGPQGSTMTVKEAAAFAGTTVKAMEKRVEEARAPGATADHPWAPLFAPEETLVGETEAVKAWVRGT